MICGTGCDIVEVERFKKHCTDKDFVERYFNKEEIGYLEPKEILEADENKLQSSAERLAARFAVKESFGKALGTGMRNFSLTEVYIVNNEEGKPEVKVCGNAEQILAEKYGNDCKIHVSISHEKKNALAFLIIERD